MYHLITALDNLSVKSHRIFEVNVGPEGEDILLEVHEVARSTGIHIYVQKDGIASIYDTALPIGGEDTLYLFDDKDMTSAAVQFATR